MSAACDNSPGQNRSRKRWLLGGGLGLLLVGVAVGVVLTTRRPTALQLADRALVAGKPAAAERSLLEHLAEFPNDTAASYKLASLLKPTDGERALEYFRRIPSDAPEYLDARRNVAQICLLTKRDDEAVLALNVLARAAPQDFGVQLSLAELWFRRGEYEKALPHARHSAVLQPNRAKTHLLVAEILDELDRVGEMIDPLRKAIQLQPDFYEARINLAYALLFAGRLDEAERQALWCLERNSRDTSALRFVATIARDRGRHDFALREIRKVLALAPDDLKCRLLEADILLFKRKPDLAYTSLKPLYEAHCDDCSYLGTLARAAAASGRLEETRTYQQRISYLLKAEPHRVK